MKLTDQFSIKDKISESTIRNLDGYLDTLAECPLSTDSKALLEAQLVMLELLITVFKRLDEDGGV